LETRTLGLTEMRLTRIGLGAWAIGGPWQFGWGVQDDNESIKTIRKALDLGINWIDTAPAYGLGHSEEIVGRAIKSYHGQFYIATKCGTIWDEARQVSHRLKAKSVRAEVEASLRRLGIDVIDLYQIHWPIPDEDIEEAWGEIARLAEEGKIRYAGVSNFSISQIIRVQSIFPVSSLQPPYSMILRDVENELLSFCASNNIGVICYSPMQSGLLTGKYTREKILTLPLDDWRRSNLHFIDPELTFNLTLIDGLQSLSIRRNCTIGQLAIDWVLRRPEITAAIVGARRPFQVEEIIQAAELNLSNDDVREIDGLLDQYEVALLSQKKGVANLSGSR